MKERNVPEQRKEATQQARSYMKLGCMNMRGWGIGKFEDVCKELNENLDLRDALQMEGNEYVMIRKGRRKQERLGRGVVLLYRKLRNLSGRQETLESEDVLAT
ncbi:hypothetical protein E2C01_078967 [Portunus trituberculatus]|uniref:Uncharacterized protein n=1 Tax=Portunus trituberculatus TaxID=210409 RepID=A0A5B7IUB2_PORTR|nr:hypothetical protein [Portunus trituberculatus]